MATIAKKATWAIFSKNGEYSQKDQNDQLGRNAKIAQT